MTPRRIAAVVPAYQASASVGAVVGALRKLAPFKDGLVLVVDDGSTDGTAEVAERAGAVVVRHATNRGKGVALRTGFAHARARGAELAVTVDADGQHFPEEAARLALHPASHDALVLGVRDLVRDGAPQANRRANRISNYFLSLFTRQALADTQCGLRRYPIDRTLALGATADGYAYEAECILRAADAKIPIVQVEVRVHYPEEHLRVTHFHAVRDPARIVFHVVRTVLAASRSPRSSP